VGGQVPGDGRHVVLHYHLFKNAGTSLDHALQAWFGAGWVEHDAPDEWLPDDVGAFVGARPEVAALSSHTAMLPPPALPGTVIHPLLFLRHPLDRIRSVHAFERTQFADTIGARIARAHDLRFYVRFFLDRAGDRSLRNFQVQRLARNLPPAAGPEPERALRTLAALPCVGIVEHYAASLALFERHLAAAFPGICLACARLNATQDGTNPLPERLARLRDELGAPLFDELAEANAADIRLYEAALRTGHGLQAAPAGGA
jgi:hypothetical protein